MTSGSTVAMFERGVVGAAIALIATPAVAQSVAHATSISGNGWVALGVIAVAIGFIFMIVFGALHLEKRDASLGRRKGDDGWFGVISSNGDDDDFHHHGGHGGHGLH